MTNLEILRMATPEQIITWLNKEAKIPKNAPKDALECVPKGWVKLKTTQSAIYISTSKIVALASMMRPDGAAAPAKAITKIHTVGAEDNPWMVDESIDAVMEKIKNA